MAATKTNLTIEQGSTFAYRVVYLRKVANVFFNIGTPGTVTWTAHGLAANDIVYFTTNGTLPATLTAGVIYYVKTVIDANTFTVSATAGGTAIDFASAGNPTHIGSAPVNMTGYSARMQIRLTKDAADPALLELTTANGRLAVTGASGFVDMLLTAAETAAITTWTSAVYDLEVVSPDATPIVTRVIEGKVKISKEVTR